MSGRANVAGPDNPNRRHGASVMPGGVRSPEYHSWRAMKNRCNNPHADSYVNYGGRGITVCDRWKNSFVDFVADMGLRPTLKHTLHRIDGNGNYELSNCKWAEWGEQAAHRRKPTRRPYSAYKYRRVSRILLGMGC